MNRQSPTDQHRHTTLPSNDRWRHADQQPQNDRWRHADQRPKTGRPPQTGWSRQFGEWDRVGAVAWAGQLDREPR